MRSAVVTHTHSSFNRIDLILEEVMEDHMMTSYRNMLTSAAYTLRRDQRDRESELKADRCNSSAGAEKVSGGKINAKNAAADKEREELGEILCGHIFNTSHMLAHDSDEMFLYDGTDPVCTIDRDSVQKQVHC